MQITSRIAPQLLSMCVMALALMQGCSTPPPVKPETPAERMERDNAMGLELSLQLDKNLKFRQDKEVLVYLRNLARKLADSMPELQSSSVGVWIVQDDGGKWNSFSLPGNRIYLSAGLLRSIEFENELAALIAIELGHVLRRHVFERLSASQDPAQTESPILQSLLPSQAAALPRTIRFFGPAGVFAYPEKSLKEATESAVRMLYNSGFDPRGVVSLLAYYERDPKRSPFEPSTIGRLQEYARQLIAQHAPLLNPIVRSTAFVTIQKRMKRL
jgi:predicted Zn-dependent protease